MNQDAVVDEAVMLPLGPEAAEAALPSQRGLAGVRRLRFPGGDTARRVVVTLTDQGIVSATSLFAAVLVGRFAGADVLGVYSIALTVVVIASVIHESLVTSPYLVIGSQHEPLRRARFATAAMNIHRRLTVGLMFALAFIAVLVTVRGFDAWQAVTWALAIVVPCTLLREYARRLALAHFRPELALACDVGTSCLQISLLVALVTLGGLTAATGLMALGAGCLVAGGAALWGQRSAFAGRRNLIADDLRQSLRFGAPVLSARVLGVVNGYVLHWFLAWKLGTAATGVFVACYTIAMLANPVLLGLGSVWGPHVAHAYANRGRSGLRAAVKTSLTVSCAIMFVLCLGLAVVGEPLMRLLYGGGEYAGQAATIVILAGHIFLGALYVCLFQGLMTLGRSGINIAIHVVSLTVTLAVAWPLVAQFSLAGAAAALLCGNIAGTGVQAVLSGIVMRDET